MHRSMNIPRCVGFLSAYGCYNTTSTVPAKTTTAATIPVASQTAALKELFSQVLVTILPITTAAAAIVPTTTPALHKPPLYCTADEYILNNSDISATSGFFIKYDSRTRNPKYVVQRSIYTSQTKNEVGKRAHSSFHPDAGIEVEAFKVRATDYNNSGYDRGHMAPAADFSASQELMNSTFTMANICPQSPQLNKGFWAKLEAWLRFMHTQEREFEDLVVITGPVFAPVCVQGQWFAANKLIGTFPRLIHVPSHFFKVVMVRPRNPADVGGAFIGAFLVPNSDDVDAKSSLSDFVVRLDELEAIVGCRFFEDALSPQERMYLDKAVPVERNLEYVLRSARDDEPRQQIASATSSPSSSSTSTAIIPYGGGVKVIVPLKSNQQHWNVRKQKLKKGQVFFSHLCDLHSVHCHLPLFDKSK